MTVEEKIQSDKKLNQPAPNLLNVINESAISNLRTNLLQTDSSKNKEKSEVFTFEHENLLPVDWSLKTRMRFLSKKPFSCNSGVKSQHESEAISNYSVFKSFYSNLDKSKFVRRELLF